MKREKNNIENIIGSSLFLKLFGIPSIIWVLLILLAMIPDDAETDPLTWGEAIGSSLVVLIIWFIISFIIVFIINKVKEKKLKSEIVKKEQYINEKSVHKLERKFESKKEFKKNLEDKCLYRYETISSCEEYKRMAKYFPNRMYWVFIKRELLKNIIYSALVEISFGSIIFTLSFFFLYQMFVMILYKVKLEYFAERVWNKRYKEGLINDKVKVEFYHDYLITNIGEFLLKVNYLDISRCIETDTNFYLECSKYNVVLIFKKNTCELELVNFIRDEFKNLENYLGESSTFKGVRKYHNPLFVKRGMLVLFVITILSLFGAMYSVELVDMVIPQHGFNFTKNMWVFWCWLPIPIISIILGFKYKGSGYSCTKNIVTGFIIGFLLIIYGAFCMFPNFSQDYSKINDYKNIIRLELPSNGELEIQNWGTYFDQDKTDYTVINAYYDREDVSRLEKEVKSSNTWFLSTEIKSELRLLMPSVFRTSDDTYFSIYNETTNQYNTVLNTQGVYIIYAMKYNIVDKHLEIHSFKYEYK